LLHTFDYTKNHFLDTDVWSAFGAVYWDVTDTVEVTAGVRYTDEDKSGYITIPYVHTFLQGTFSSPPVIDGLDFDDDNWSPELAVNWYVTPDISVFAAYKQGFKSGGVDNSALPTAALDPSNPDFPDFLIYESEDAKGGEVGTKANLLDGSMRLNATAFYYIYEDLQVQLFDAVAIQFSTFNASELTVYGGEADSVWFAPFMEGLQLRGALTYTHAEYTDDFFNAQGQNLDGEDRERNAEWAGYAGFSYDRELGGYWAMELSADARYSDEYRLAAETSPDIQDSFWLYDAALRLYSQDDRYEVSFIGRNLGDEIYAYGNGPRPGACAGQVGDVCTGGRQDQVTSTSLGVTYTLQLRVRL
jgi:iron complex outermembrane receptor protein